MRMTTTARNRPPRNRPTNRSNRCSKASSPISSESPPPVWSRSDIVVIGAGAAGLAAAIFTRRLAPNQSVLLLDGAKKPGAKILVSGGSRCNVTNVTVDETDFWGGPRSVVRRVLRGLSVRDTIAFFEQLGVRLHEEAGGKLFP